MLAVAQHVPCPNGEFEEHTKQLYAAVDKNRDGQLDVKEVAALFKHLAPDQSIRSAYNAAVEALLLTDSDADRHLNISEFDGLLKKVAGIAGISAETAVQRLLTAIQAVSTSPRVHHTQSQGQVGVPTTEASSGMTAASSSKIASVQAVEPSGADKLQQLFRLWDQEGDGSISFNELCQGLAKFKPIAGKQDVTAVLTGAASILTTHDADGDRRLQFDEFTVFMMEFMGAAGYQLDEVLDELIVLAGKRDSKKLQAVLDSAQEQISNVLAASQQ